MFAKNNEEMKMRREAEQRSRFSIRKLTIGAASVMIGCVFFMGANGTVKADTTTPAAQTESIKAPNSGRQLTEEEKEEAAKTLRESDEVKKQAAEIAAKETPEQEKAELEKEAQERAEMEAESAKEEAARKAAWEKHDEAMKAAEKQDADSTSDKKVENKEVEAIQKQLNNHDTAEDLTADEVANAKILPQVAVEGEVPTLDINAIWNPHMNRVVGEMCPTIEAEDPSTYKLSWAKAPDVSKVGQSNGTVKFDYVANYDDDGNPIYGSFTFDIPVDVVAGQKKDKDQVRNTLNVIDADTNKVIYHYTWIGAKGGEYPSDDNVNPALGNDTDLFDKSITNLGYKFADQEQMGSPEYDLDYFLDHDITRVREVVASSKDENGKPKLAIVENPYSYDEGSASNVQVDPYEYVSDPAHQDPAEYIYGLGYLDPTDTVVWKDDVKPTYQDTLDDKGNFIETKVTNDPAIQIKDKDGNVLHEFGGDSLKRALEYNYNIIYGGGEKELNATVKGLVKVVQGDKLPDASSVVTTLPTDDTYRRDDKDVQEKLNKYFNVTWKIAPDVNRVGYQFGYIQITPKDDLSDEDASKANLMLMSFFAEPESHDYRDNFDYSEPLAVLVKVSPKPAKNPVQPTNNQPTQPTKPVQPSNNKPTQPTQASQPTKPAQPTEGPSKPSETPAQPSEAQPTSPETPAPVHSQEESQEVAPVHASKAPEKAAKKHSKSVRPGAAHHVASHKAQPTMMANHEAKAELPQTGEKQSKAAIFGLALVAIASLFGIVADKKRN